MRRLFNVLLPLWLRHWAWSSFPWHRPWYARIVERLAFAVAQHYDHDPKLCWASLALWAMGFEGYTLDRATDDCGWCGKCKPKENA